MSEKTFYDFLHKKAFHLPCDCEVIKTKDLGDYFFKKLKPVFFQAIKKYKSDYSNPEKITPARVLKYAKERYWHKNSEIIVDVTVFCLGEKEIKRRIKKLIKNRLKKQGQGD